MLKTGRLIAIVVGVLGVAAAQGDAARWRTDMRAGQDFLDRGDYGRAAKSFKSAANTARSLGKEDWRRGGALNNQAVALTALADYPSAATLLGQSSEWFVAGFGADSALALPALQNLATLAELDGDPKASEQRLRRAVSVAVATLGDSDPRAAAARLRLARWLLASGDLDRAGTELDAALTTARAGIAEDSPAFAPFVLAESLLQAARGERAEALAGVARAAALTQGKADYLPQWVGMQLAHARLLAADGRLDDAAAALNEAANALSEAGKAEHPLAAEVQESLAALLLDRADYAQAEAAYKRARTIRSRGLGSGHPSNARPAAGLAEVYIAQNRLREAQTAIKSVSRALGKFPRATEQLALGLARAKLALARGEFSAAGKELDSAVELMVGRGGPAAPGIAPLLLAAARVALPAGQVARAEELGQRVESLIAARPAPESAARLTALKAGIAFVNGDAEHAQTLYAEALSQAEELGGAAAMVRAQIAVQAVDAALLTGATQPATDALEAAEQALEPIYGKRHPLLAQSVFARGVLALEAAAYQDAQNLFSQSLALREEVLPAGHPATGASLQGAGVALAALGRLPDAEQSLKRAVSIGQRAYGAKDVRNIPALLALARVQFALARDKDAGKTAARAVKLAGTDPGLSAAGIQALRTAGMIAAAGNDNAAAVKLYERAASAGSAGPRAARERSAAALDLAALHRRRGEWDASQQWLDKAAGFADSPRVAVARSDLAAARGQADAARDGYEQALSDLQARYGDVHPRVLAVRTALAALASGRGEHAEAIRILTEVEATTKERYADGHPLHIVALQALAAARANAGELSQAESNARAAQAQAEKTYGFRHPRSALAQAELALALLARDRPADAQPLLRRAKSTLERAYGRADVRVAPVLDAMALQLLREAKYTAAAAILDDILGRIVKAQGEDSLGLGYFLARRARIAALLGDAPGAVAGLRRAMALDTKYFTNPHPGTASLRLELAEVFLGTGDLAAAREMLDKTSQVLDAMGGDSPLRVRLQRDESSLAVLSGDLELAREHLANAESVAAQVISDNHPDHAALLVDKIRLAIASGEVPNSADRTRAGEILTAAFGADSARVQALVVLDVLSGADGESSNGQVLADLEERLGGAHPALGAALTEFGIAELRRGEARAAASSLERAASIFERTFGAGHARWLRARRAQVRALLASGDSRRARGVAERAVKAAVERLGETHLATILARASLADALAASDQFDTAGVEYDKALSGLRELLGARHTAVAEIAWDAGRSALRGRDFDAGERNLREALDILGARLGDTDRSIGDLHLTLGELFELAKRPDAAREQYAEALRVHESVLGAQAPETALDFIRLAGVDFAAGDLQSAADSYSQALDIHLGAAEPDPDRIDTLRRSLAAVFVADARYDEASAVLADGQN